MSNEVGFNQQYLKLKMQYEFLKEQCANQLELYTHLVEVEGPNIKARYMMLVGQYEHQVFELKAEIARWKRRFTLRQAALNRGEKPNLVAIEVELDKEFAEYIEEVKKQWQADRLFTPSMDEAAVKAAKAGWADAIERTLTKK